MVGLRWSSKYYYLLDLAGKMSDSQMEIQIQIGEYEYDKNRNHHRYCRCPVLSRLGHGLDHCNVRGIK